MEHMPDDQIMAITNPIIDILMEATTAIDHERHVPDFTERLKNIVTSEYLRKVCATYQREKSYFARRELVAVYKRAGAAAVCMEAMVHEGAGGVRGRNAYH